MKKETMIYVAYVIGFVTFALAFIYVTSPGA